MAIRQFNHCFNHKDIAGHVRCCFCARNIKDKPPSNYCRIKEINHNREHGDTQYYTDLPVPKKLSNEELLKLFN